MTEAAESTGMTKATITKAKLLQDIITNGIKAKAIITKNATTIAEIAIIPGIIITMDIAIIIGIAIITTAVMTVIITVDSTPISKYIDNSSGVGVAVSRRD